MLSYYAPTSYTQMLKLMRGGGHFIYSSTLPRHVQLPHGTNVEYELDSIYFDKSHPQGLPC
jgi:hypothetical protein